VTAITLSPDLLCYCLKSDAMRSMEPVKPGSMQATAGRFWGEIAVERALKSHSLWLTLTYIGLILLMVRGMA